MSARPDNRRAYARSAAFFGSYGLSTMTSAPRLAENAARSVGRALDLKRDELAQQVTAAATTVHRLWIARFSARLCGSATLDFRP